MDNIICPKCGQFQEKAISCSSCGVIIAKVRKVTSAAPTTVVNDTHIEISCFQLKRNQII